MAPKAKYYGSLSLDGVKKAVTEISAKVNDSDKYGKQLKVNAAMWEDGNISIDIYNSDTKESIKLGSLRVSKFDNESAPSSSSKDADLPF